MVARWTLNPEIRVQFSVEPFLLYLHLLKFSIKSIILILNSHSPKPSKIFQIHSFPSQTLPIIIHHHCDFHQTFFFHNFQIKMPSNKSKKSSHFFFLSNFIPLPFNPNFLFPLLINQTSPPLQLIFIFLGAVHNLNVRPKR